MEDGDDDLLGGDFGGQANVDSQEMSGFESSFPAIDTTNEVSMCCLYRTRCARHVKTAGSLRLGLCGECSFTFG